MRRGRGAGGGNRLLSRNLVYVIDTFHLSIYHTTKIRRIITSNTPLDIISISFDIIGISFDVIDISFDVIDIS